MRSVGERLIYTPVYKITLWLLVVTLVFMMHLLSFATIRKFHLHLDILASITAFHSQDRGKTRMDIYFLFVFILFTMAHTLRPLFCKLACIHRDIWSASDSLPLPPTPEDKRIKFISIKKTFRLRIKKIIVYFYFKPMVLVKRTSCETFRRV